MVRTSKRQRGCGKATELLNEMLKQGFYDGHIAKPLYFISMALERLGKTTDSENMRNRAVEIARNLNGPEWAVKNVEEDFDNLVFFHDRWFCQESKPRGLIKYKYTSV
ncbi:hypothetical protein B7494_g6876 [Chlorociboria aeruginascens]|nr:hypothetical protein B7494_g6876 [Chlorociboria aeruginascens]